MERKAFPRGGGVEDAHHTENRGSKQSHWLPPQKRKTRPEKPKNDSDSDPDADYELEERLQKETKAHVVIRDLDYKTVHPKMKLLARVAEVHDNYVRVHLPGSILGIIPISSFREAVGPTTDKLQSVPALTDLVKEDQIIITQVSAVHKDDKHQGRETNVVLTINPKAIYEGWNHSQVAKKGCVLQAVVRSEEDHGYILDCGIPDLQVFLNKKECARYCEQWNNNNPLVKGQIVRGVVVKTRTADVASLVELSVEPPRVSKAENSPSDSVDNISQLVPGMRYMLDVSKKMSNGIGVTFDDFDGFVVETNIPYIYRSADVGKSYLGCLLYVSKPLNVPMFSLVPSVVDSTARPERQLAYGDVVKKALVESVTHRGVGLLLCKTRGIRGFVPLWFKKNSEKESGSKDMHQVGKKIPCRVLSFHSMTETYLCTTQKSCLEERLFSVSDAPVGKKVTATVKSVTGKGVHVVVGAIAGFIPWVHTADLPLRSFGDKFHPGMKINGRVLQHAAGKLVITSKETLLKKDCPILKSYDQAVEKKVYFGTLTGMEDNRCVVKFFGDVKGYIPIDMATLKLHRSKLGHSGRVVKCSVTSVGDELLLSFEDNNEELQVGDECSPIVSGINVKEEVLHVVVRGSIRGVIPAYHLHDCKKLATALFGTYSIGSVVENARCYNNGANPVFSTRGSVRRFFESDTGKDVSKGGSTTLQEGNVFPCFVKTIPKCVSTYIILSTPLADSNFIYRIGHEVLETKSFEVGDYVPLFVKDVEKRLYDGRLSVVWKNEVQSSAAYLADIMEGHSLLKSHAVNIGSAISAFSVGETVSGPIESDETEYRVLLPNGVKGHIDFFCTDKPLSVGEIIEGKVIYVDYLRSELVLTAQKEVCSRLDDRVLEDSPVEVTEGQVLNGRIVRCFPDFFLAIVNVGDNFRRAFIPKYAYPCPGAPKLMKKILAGEGTQFTVVKTFENSDLLVLVPKACVKKLKLKLGGTTTNDEQETVKAESGEEPMDTEPSEIPQTEETFIDEQIPDKGEESDDESTDAEQSGKESAKGNAKKRRRRRRRHSSSSEVVENGVIVKSKKLKRHDLKSR